MNLGEREQERRARELPGTDFAEREYDEGIDPGGREQRYPGAPPPAKAPPRLGEALVARRARWMARRRSSGAEQARMLLQAGFTVAPIAAGLDKFGNRLVDWERYLAPGVARSWPGGARGFMRMVGVVEIAAGLLVAARPRLGGYVVAGWLGGIVGNLVSQRRYLDVALRDVGLAISALALARLAGHRGNPAVAGS